MNADADPDPVHTMPATSFSIDRENLRRLAISLVADELASFSGSAITPQASSKWTDATSLTEDGLGFDSLGLLNVAGRANQFFHLHEIGIEDYLLAKPSIGSWLDVLEKAFSIRCEKFTFQTSGSTGEPAQCEHELKWLLKDAQAILDLLPKSGRIISMVPPHHIYGFIYTILMPQISGREWVDARVLSPGSLTSLLKEGDIIISTPHLWRYFIQSVGSLPDGVHGLTSTAPMPASLSQKLISKGLEQLIEVYGSSETGGIGWRNHHNKGFTLFDWWAQPVDASVQLTRVCDGEGPTIFPLMDNLKFSSDGTFVPAGRLDHAVQVGGINVFPKRVAEVLKEHPGVAECAVRCFAPGDNVENQRLKVFIVPASGVESYSLQEDIKEYTLKTLKTHERPVAFTFGETLPRNDMGKLTDWPD